MIFHMLAAAPRPVAPYSHAVEIEHMVAKRVGLDEPDVLARLRRRLPAWRARRTADRMGRP